MEKAWSFKTADMWGPIGKCGTAGTKDKNGSMNWSDKRWDELIM